jgi:GTPase SAR1 family protein
VEFRLAYCGPRGSGKTTNLRFIETAISHGDLTSIIRTCTSSIGKAPIDFLSFTLESRDAEPIDFRITSLPQFEDYRHLWKMILHDSHGVVVVLDSRLESVEENRSSLWSLMDAITSWKRKVESVPVVLQFNKSDLPGALPLDVLDRRVNFLRKDSLRASAIQGDGVLETFMTVSNLLITAGAEAGKQIEWLGGGSP